MLNNLREARAFVKSLLASGVRVEVAEIGKRGDGKTEYKVSVDDADLQKLRTGLGDYKREVSQYV